MLALVDVDRFKLINDRYGHTAGDDVLRALAALLRQWAPQHGVGRMGGEEFGLLMHGEDEATLLAELEALMRGVRAQRFTIDATLQVTVSIGVAVAEPGVPFNETTLLQRADTALYRAKALGRDRIEVDAPVSSRSDVHQRELQRFMDATQVYSERMALLMKTFGRRLAERSRQDALHDELTGAFNRRYFNERMAREWAQVTRHGVPLSVVFLDLDNFGQVNRQHGFRNGDAVLKRVVEIVGEQIRLSDWLARWGGEEFCVVLPGTPLAEAAEVAQRVRVAVEAAAFALTDGDTLRLTCSLGVASTGTGMNMQDASDLTEAASRAARQAKAAGKNRVVLDSVAG
jgi:two-component system cell cycle response regulator